MTQMPGIPLPQPGWYADPWAAAELRWWDGAQWTAHTHTTPRFSPATPTANPFIWAVVLLPLLSILGLALFDLNGYVIRGMHTLVPSLGPWYFALLGLNWLTYFGLVLLAYFDWRELGRRGLPQPFHWAWAFLSSFVYVIGRVVVIRRRGGRDGMAPVWVLIGVAVTSLVVAIVKIAGVVSLIFTMTSGAWV